MAELAEKMAQKINLNDSEINNLNLIAKLHDIGKTVIPENILNKKEKLTAADWKEIKSHPAVGHRILNATEEFSHISEEVLSHHENWDGSGYPRGLKEDEIPLLARIIAVVDAYDVMTHKQVYKKAVSNEEALKEIKKNAGTQFDPELADVFIELMLE
jgi:HD-GYP domain-containing protein (c-di-GMP phosphodiesterase class II)